MQTDTMGPRTWVLVAVLGWALLVWVLALLGLGGQIRKLPSDPTLGSELPQLQLKVVERLGPLDQYPHIASQPIFSPSRQPQSFFISGNGTETAKTLDFILTSVLLTPDFQMAILQPKAGGEGVRLKVGDAPPTATGWRLSTVNTRSAVFDGPEGQHTLELRTFDGIGGQAPTAATSVSLPSASPSAQSTPTRSVVTDTQASPDGIPNAAKVSTSAVPTPRKPAPVSEPALTTEQRMDSIRKRVEARRAQLSTQGQSPPPPNKTK